MKEEWLSDFVPLSELYPNLRTYNNDLTHEWPTTKLPKRAIIVYNNTGFIGFTGYQSSEAAYSKSSYCSGSITSIAPHDQGILLYIPRVFNVLACCFSVALNRPSFSSYDQGMHF